MHRGLKDTVEQLEGKTELLDRRLARSTSSKKEAEESIQVITLTRMHMHDIMPCYSTHSIGLNGWQNQVHFILLLLLSSFLFVFVHLAGRCNVGYNTGCCFQ